MFIDFYLCQFAQSLLFLIFLFCQLPLHLCSKNSRKLECCALVMIMYYHFISYICNINLITIHNSQHQNFAFCQLIAANCCQFHALYCHYLQTSSYSCHNIYIYATSFHSNGKFVVYIGSILDSKYSFFGLLNF